MVNCKSAKWGIMAICGIITIVILSYSINVTSNKSNDNPDTLIIADGKCYIKERNYCLHDQGCLEDDCFQQLCESHVNCTIDIEGIDNNTTTYVGTIYSNNPSEDTDISSNNVGNTKMGNEKYYKSGHTYDAYFLYNKKTFNVISVSWNDDIQNPYKYMNDLPSILGSLITALVIVVILSIAATTIFVWNLIKHINNHNHYSEV